MNAISTLWTILLVIAFFGVMIFVHEFGHFCVARLCKIKVLEFALGMGPKILKHRSKKSGTLYSLRLFPIGGFCSMLGENDDGSEEMNDKHAFCRRPAWQRFLVLLAGAFMNIFTAVLAMFILLSARGNYISNTVSGFFVPSASAGLQFGDTIVAVGDTEVTTITAFDTAIADLKTDLCTLTVRRGDETLVLEDIGLPQQYVNGAFVRVPDFKLDPDTLEVTSYSAASADAGLLPGDKILKVNSTPISVYSDISWEIALSGSEACDLTVQRGEELVAIKDIHFPVTSESGVVMGGADFALEVRTFNGFFDIFGETVKESISTIKIIYRSLVELIAGRFGVAGVSGPVGAAKSISEAASYGISSLLYLFAFVSMNLGIFNLLPFPALDGGRLLFVLLEMIRRKPVNQKYEGLVHAIGMVLLLGLMAFVTIMDVLRLIGG